MLVEPGQLLPLYLILNPPDHCVSTLFLKAGWLDVSVSLCHYPLLVNSVSYSRL